MSIPDTDIRTYIETLFAYMGYTNADITIVDDDGHVRVAVTLPSGDLIGPNGSYITALNHICKRNAEQHGWPIFSVDINDYFEAQNEALRERARVAAERARTYKTTIELDPMNSYERMIVHSALADEVSIQTESQGEGRDRHITIIYTPSHDDVANV